MEIIDTHTHIYSKEFDGDRWEVILRAKEAGVAAVILPNEDSKSVDALNGLCDEYPDYAFPMMGLHPTSVGDDYRRELRLAEAALGKRTYCGIGEIGLDYYWDRSHTGEQREAFAEQLKWSAAMQLPVTVHTRDAFADVFDIIYNVGAENLKGVFHCFGGGIDEWREIQAITTFYVGLGGVVTFKNSTALRDALREIPLERIVVETDAPYLAPAPFRGKRNEPAYVRETVKKLAEIYETTEEIVAKKTFQNAMNLFQLPVKIVNA